MTADDTHFYARKRQFDSKITFRELDSDIKNLDNQIKDAFFIGIIMLIYSVAQMVYIGVN